MFIEGRKEGRNVVWEEAWGKMRIEPWMWWRKNLGRNFVKVSPGLVQFNKYLLSTSCLPGILLAAGAHKRNKLW